jgi:hypothetical protein
LLHSSTRSCFLVEPVVKVLPQEQTTWASVKYLGCIFSFILLLFSVNADPLSIISGRFEFDFTIDQGINGIIFSQSDIVAGLDLGPVLPDYNSPCQDFFPCISFDTQSLSGTIPAVSGAASALFMSHLTSPLLVFVNIRFNDIVDDQPGILLAVSGLLRVMGLVLELEYDYFFGLDQTL